MSTSRIHRIIKILTGLQSARHYAVEDLAKLFRTSRRTVFRDLRDLQEAGIPCYYDPKTKSYTIDGKFFLPVLDLNARETLGLLLLVHKARNYIALPLERAALWAALKIENNLASKVKRFCAGVLEYITVKACPQATFGGLDKTFVQLLEAILKRRVVKIRYQSSNEQKDLAFDLRPCHLFHNEYAWYVLGESSLHNGIRAFKLNRIKDLLISDKFFASDKKFDIKEHLGRAWSMIPEGRLHHVKLRFSPEVAADVAEVQWHTTQTVFFEDDGSAIIEFRVDGLGEITWWILRYGDRVQVLAPEILRRQIIEMAQNIVRQNRQLLPV